MLLHNVLSCTHTINMIKLSVIISVITHESINHIDPLLLSLP